MLGGKPLRNKGRCVIHGQVDGQEFPVVFSDVEVELPILSVRKMVKRQNDVQFTAGGGTIRNRRTGGTFHFFEHDGVYVLKLKVAAPDLILDSPAEDNADADSPPDDLNSDPMQIDALSRFHRQGK